MPLLDDPPLKEGRSWQGIRSIWANAIVAQLNEPLLPTDYFAIAHIKSAVKLKSVWQR